MATVFMGKWCFLSSVVMFATVPMATSSICAGCCVLALIGDLIELCLLSYCCYGSVALLLLLCLFCNHSNLAPIAMVAVLVLILLQLGYA